VVFTAFVFATALIAQQTVVPDPPEARDQLTLTAAYDAEQGHNAFFFAGKPIPPIIRVLPGAVINLGYVNNLPVHSKEHCALGPCLDQSNLHFHGLHVSPDKPQDDVLTMMSTPGHTLNYQVEIPSYAAPGLYWYHTHPHGESARQALDGMSGAIVIDGIDRYYPALRQMRERVLVLRERDIEDVTPSVRRDLLQRVGLSPERCGTSTEQRPERIFTLNGEIRPQIPIHPGERQFWRIVNASPDRYADLQLDGQQLEIVALDGMPLAYHDRNRPTLKVDHILLAPAARVEAIVTGPAPGTRPTLSTRCLDTGPDGNLTPAMILADLVTGPQAIEPSHKVPSTSGAPAYREFSRSQLEEVESSLPDFTAVFTEDKNGFYINGKKFSMDDEPLVKVRVGSLQHWRIVNSTREIHPFHIHQVHFLAYKVDDARPDRPEWLDTVNVPYEGTVDLVMDLTDPIIRGMSVFHCHLLNHEDKGMMAKILFE
jgi:FtsP/CotA-like multicopper oxidase with cupredoxin domain